MQLSYGLMQNAVCWPRAYILCLILFIPENTYANLPSEYDVKLAYLYNFTRFVDWPKSAFDRSDSPYSICIMGRIPSYSAAKKLEQKQSRNRPIDVTVITSEQPTHSWHLLYITKSVKYARFSSRIKGIDNTTVTVGETPGFAKHGGEIGFVMDNRNHVKIEVNVSNALAKGIEIRAKLLEVASKIYRNENRNK